MISLVGSLITMNTFFTSVKEQYYLESKLEKSMHDHENFTSGKRRKRSNNSVKSGSNEHINSSFSSYPLRRISETSLNFKEYHQTNDISKCKHLFSQSKYLGHIKRKTTLQTQKDCISESLNFEEDSYWDKNKICAVYKDEKYFRILIEKRQKTYFKNKTYPSLECLTFQLCSKEKNGILNKHNYMWNQINNEAKELISKIIRKEKTKLNGTEKVPNYSLYNVHLKRCDKKKHIRKVITRTKVCLKPSTNSKPSLNNLRFKSYLKSLNFKKTSKSKAFSFLDNAITKSSEQLKQIFPDSSYEFVTGLNSQGRSLLNITPQQEHSFDLTVSKDDTKKTFNSSTSLLELLFKNLINKNKIRQRISKQTINNQIETTSSESINLKRTNENPTLTDHETDNYDSCCCKTINSSQNTILDYGLPKSNKSQLLTAVPLAALNTEEIYPKAEEGLEDKLVNPIEKCTQTIYSKNSCGLNKSKRERENAGSVNSTKNSSVKRIMKATSIPKEETLKTQKPSNDRSIKKAKHFQNNKDIAIKILQNKRNYAYTPKQSTTINSGKTTGKSGKCILKNILFSNVDDLKIYKHQRVI